MKKTLILLLAVLTILTLASCAMHTKAGETPVTQPIAQSTPAAAQGEEKPAAVQVETAAPDTTPDPLPETGAAVTIATPPPVQSTGAAAIDNELSLEAAQAIALAHAGLTEADVTYVLTERDWDDGCLKYEIEFCHGDHEYDYDIDACTGAIRSFDTEIEHHSSHHGDHHHSNAAATTPAPQSGELLTEAEVKAIALTHAGVSEDEARFEKVQLDKDRSAWEYDIEFRVGRTEYEYEIDAFTGKILDADKDYDD